jgi:hypothetical protein
VYATRFKRPPTTCSQSWILRFERVYPGILGDLRDDPSQIDYPFAVPAKNVDDDSSEQQWDEDDMKGVWRSILACSQEMERDLRNGRRLLLSDVTNFLRRAYCLPVPEEAFGTRHLLVEGISDSFHNLLDFVSKARDVQAKLIDLLYDDSGEGVDMDAVQKYLAEVPNTCNIKLDEEAIVAQQLECLRDWKSRLDKLARDYEIESEDGDGNDDDVMEDDEHRNELAAAEQLALEGVTKLAFRSKELVLLEKRIAKAHLLDERIKSWKNSVEQGTKEMVKFVSGLVREANRINLSSPEVLELIAFHRSVQEWIERANLAIRSRVPLSEVKALILKAESTPLDLSEYVDKLCSRRNTAQAWIEELEDFVPCPRRDGAVDGLQWMSRMREALQSSEKDDVTYLQDLAMEGTRIPVEIDSVKMLMSEIDAKNWSAKG